MNHGGQLFRIVKQRTGSQEILVERLVFAVFHEQRRLEGFQERLFLDVGIGVVNECARFDVAGRIDMEIAASACDASADEFAVVPEVHGEQGLRPAEFPDLVIHEFALLRGNEQVGDGVLADGNIGKQPCELAARAIISSMYSSLPMTSAFCLV